MTDIFLDLFGYLAPFVFGTIALFKVCQSVFAVLKEEAAKLTQQLFERMVDYLFEVYFPKLTQAITDKDYLTVFGMVIPCVIIWLLWFLFL